MSQDSRRIVFISHTTKNDPFVAELRGRLERRGYKVLEDSQFHAGDNLPGEIKNFLDQAATVIAVSSQEAAGSHWVKRELRYARDKSKRIIPILFPNSSSRELGEILELPPTNTDDNLEDWPPYLIGILLPERVGAVDALMPTLFDALEGRGGGGKIEIGQLRPPVPLADLVLRLRATRFELVKNPHGAEVRRPVATACLAYYPPEATLPAAESDEFTLAAPLGKIEADELRFYLERYHIVPYGVFAQRAHDIEDRLPEWGQDLWEAIQLPTTSAVAPLSGTASGNPKAASPIQQWQSKAQVAERRFTVEAPPARKLLRQASEEEQLNHRLELESTTELLALPWELLHDAEGYLFHDGIGVRVRRSLPGRVATEQETAQQANEPPLRILAVCARPDTEGIGYIDHRVSIQPLIESLNSLGELVQYEILSPPTFPELCDKLKEAQRAGRPFHVVHFDGHGVYDKTNGLGALVFEHPDDVAAGKLSGRRAQIVSADEMAKYLRNSGVRLFFLEACQSAQAEGNPGASVAGRLLQSGVASVVAMSHSVLVETARRFTAEFYAALVKGQRVGAAMLQGQRILERDRRRGWAWQPRSDQSGKVQRHPLELHDWFIPVLYQDREDPVLLTSALPAQRVQQELVKERSLLIGNLPAPPPHSFVGRSRLLLAAERLMLEADKQYVVLRGEGGEGKTTLATELARWLVSTRRVNRAAFASVENLPEDASRAVLTAWGQQLLPDFAARANNVDDAVNTLVDQLRNHSVLLVLDNMESILPPPPDSEAAGARVYDAGVLDGVLEVCRRLCELAPRTRIVFTSREGLPADSAFGDRSHQIDVGRLSPEEGMELVARVLASGVVGQGSGAVSSEALRASKEDEITDLVTLVGAHARALVLLTPELARRGLRATTEDMATIMAEMERRYPGERERSLFASLELSLRRLPADVRAKLAPLGVFQGGGIAQNCGHVAGWDNQADEELRIGQLLDEVGLAEFIPLSVPYLRFDPALAPALLRELRERGAEAEAEARMRWAGATWGLVHFLCQELGSDIHLATRLLLLELPNLLAALRYWSQAMDGTGVKGSIVGTESSGNQLIEATPEMVIDFATLLEQLIARRGRREALAEVESIRQRAANQHQMTTDGLTHAAFNAAQAGIERLLQAGRFGEAVRAAESLVQRCEMDHEDAYPLLRFDFALAQLTLGRAYKRSGEPEKALTTLSQARTCFEGLAQTMTDPQNRESSSRMASACVTEEADCLANLGQLDQAAERYEKAIRLDKKRGDLRDVAVGQGQLGTVRQFQRRYADALEAHNEARQIFESFGEPSSVAVAWHQIGNVHQLARDLDKAESAYLKSLAIEIDQGHKAGEASSRNQLGILYDQIPGRKEDAVTFKLQAAEIYAAPEIADQFGEGSARSNAAGTLLALGRLPEARQQLTLALQCKAQFGHNAEPWKTWHILYNLETASGNPTAAAEARGQAIASYAAARRSGWQVTQGPAAQLCEWVAFILAAKNPATSPESMPAEQRQQLFELELQLSQKLEGYLNDSSAPAYLRALSPALLAILDGSRDPSLATNPALDYDDAAELLLLLERVS